MHKLSHFESKRSHISSKARQKPIIWSPLRLEKDVYLINALHYDSDGNEWFCTGYLYGWIVSRN